MMFFAFGFGVWLAMRRARQVSIPPQFVMDITVWLMVGGLGGARITYVLFHISEFRGRWLDIISPIQSDGTIGIAGLVVLGGVIGGAWVTWYYSKRKGQPFLKVLDLLLPSLAFGIALGRIGCYLNGCCFGHPTELPWGVTFPATCYAGSIYGVVEIHPTQLYAALYNTLIGLFLLWRTKSKRFEGELFFWFLTIYGVARFVNETLRYYRPGMILFDIGNFPLTMSMIVSAAMTVSGVYLLVKGMKSVR